MRIERPIIICGLPRTGTTHLHNLISADPAMRSLPYWESLEPVLPEAERPRPGDPDPRPARTAIGLEVLAAAMPYFNRMHEMTVDHVHEEIQLLAIDISTMLFETQALMPSWRDFFKAGDQTASLRVPAHHPQGAPVATGRRALGAQVAPAPRAVRSAGIHVPRRHLRGDPPGPVIGDHLDGHDGRLHLPHVGRARGSRRPSARTGRPGSRTCSGRARTAETCCRPTVDRPPVRRVHGGRHGRGRAGLRPRRSNPSPTRHARPWRPSGHPSPRPERDGRLPAGGAGHRPCRTPRPSPSTGSGSAWRQRSRSGDECRRSGAAGVDDVRAVLALWREADAEPSHTDDVASLERLITHDAGSLMVAEVDGRIIGTVIAGWDGWRGRSTGWWWHPPTGVAGLGRQLVGSAQERLSTVGASRLQAIVVETDGQATGILEGQRVGTAGRATPVRQGVAPLPRHPPLSHCPAPGRRRRRRGSASRHFGDVLELDLQGDQEADVGVGQREVRCGSVGGHLVQVDDADPVVLLPVGLGPVEDGRQLVERGDLQSEMVERGARRKSSAEGRK